MPINMNDIREYSNSIDNNVDSEINAEIVGKIRHADRLNNTPSGNPRYKAALSFRNHYWLETRSLEIEDDSAAGYDIQSYINGGVDMGADVTVTVVNGKITKIQKVSN